MKRYLALLLLFLLLLPCAAPALAAQSRVIDEADLLSDADEAALAQAIALIGDEYQFDVVLLNKTSIDGKNPRYYAADYFDYGGYGYGDTRDGIILLLVTGAGVGDRDYAIINTGRAEKLFDDNALYAIEADILPYLSASRYSTGLARFVADVEARLEYMTPMKRTVRVSGIMTASGAVVGLIVALIFRGQMRTVRRKIGAKSYIRDGSFNLNRVQDIYLYTTTTRRRIETPSSGGGHGGGGGGFTGSSGTHHTGHSGKF